MAAPPPERGTNRVSLAPPSFPRPRSREWAHHSQVVFGTAEGKVKIGQIAEHKTITLYSTQSHVTALAAGPDGHSVVSGHVDGTIYR